MPNNQKISTTFIIAHEDLSSCMKDGNEEINKREIKSFVEIKEDKELNNKNYE